MPLDGAPTAWFGTIWSERNLMPARFEMLDADAGVFVFPDTPFDGLVAEFDGLLDGRERRAASEKEYVAGLERLIREEPDFVDAHAHLAYAWIEQGKPKKALDASLAGLARANRLIPEGFAGRIEWGHLDNRPYLRAMHAAVLGYMRLRRHQDAAVLVERMLAFNPNDNQGVRYLLGSELIRAGEPGRARSVIEAECGNYPPYQYELALLHLQAGQWIAAATALRRGFCANPYIAEVLCGTSDPMPLAIWHGSNLAEPETARDYVASYGALWLRRPDFVAFVRWLFQHSRVLGERSAVLACREELQWEREFKARSAVVDRLDQLEAAIDDALSKELVVQRADRQGRPIWPWMVHLLP
jgi:tetratricopeptide (TPR) repeat protein